MEPLFEAQFARIRDSLVVDPCAELDLPPGRARDRMRALKELHEFWLAESDGIMQRWRRRRHGR
jgi:hypothetical protein